MSPLGVNANSTSPIRQPFVRLIAAAKNNRYFVVKQIDEMGCAPQKPLQAAICMTPGADSGFSLRSECLAEDS